MRDARETHGIWLYATPDQIQGRHAPAVKNVRAETGPRDRAVLKSFVYVELFFESLFTGKVSQRVVRETANPRTKGRNASQTGDEERGVSGPLRSRTVRPNATN